MEKVSIVVPIYNVEKYLEKCLDSLVTQTYDNIEMILVNDGSTDQSLQIAEKYLKKYEQIRLIDQENGGLSKARNTGMKLAKGKYLCFVDSDDWLEPNTVQEIVARMEAENLDLCLYGANGYLSDENETKQYPEGDYNYSINYSGWCSGKELLVRLYAAGEFHAMACMYMIKRELVVKNKLTFIEGFIHEDELFTPYILYYADRVGLQQEKYYNKRIRKNSIVTGSKALEHMKGYGAVFLGLSECPGCQDENREVAECYSALCMERLQQSLNYYVLLRREERKTVKIFAEKIMKEKRKQRITLPFVYYMYLLKEYMIKGGKR